MIRFLVRQLPKTVGEGEVPLGFRIERSRFTAWLYGWHTDSARGLPAYRKALHA